MVSVIICTRNRATHLQQTLQSLADVHLPEEWDVEALIVDNGSSDDTREVVMETPLPKFQKRLITEPREGKSHALNRALEKASGDIFLFADDDVRFPKDWIIEMTKPIREGGADAVAGAVRIPPYLERPWMEDWHRSYLGSSRRIEEEPVDDFMGANMCVARYVFEEVGTYDTNLGGGALGLCDESELARSVINSGFNIHPAFQIEVEHHFDSSLLLRYSFISRSKQLGRSMAYIHFKKGNKVGISTMSKTKIYIDLIKLHIKLFMKRLTNISDVLRDEGMASWENYYIREIAYLKQGLKERRTSRKYSEYGLHRKSCEHATDHASP